MPTSEQNLRILKGVLPTLSDEDLLTKIRQYAALSVQERERREVPLVDVWAERELASHSEIKSELPSLSVAGLERLAEHLQERFLLVQAELRRRRKKGHPSKPNMWLVSLYYYELSRRGLAAEAKKFRAKLDVSERTLKRYRDNPHRDER